MLASAPRRPALASALRTLALAACALAATACGAATATSTSRGLLVVPSDPEAERLERAMFERLNRDREQLGRPPLTWDDTLADIARSHSFDMQQRAFFAHDSPHTGSLDDRVRRAGYAFATVRENLALSTDIDTAQDNLLKSPGHFDNIMADDVVSLGIGIVRGPFEDFHEALYITQVFASPLEPLQPADASPIHSASLAPLDALDDFEGISALLEPALVAIVETRDPHGPPAVVLVVVARREPAARAAP